ncbi:MAG: hypothetical protein ACYS8W_14390 [Planctomycetota bacterium]|jgi:hypothetical protein
MTQNPIALILRALIMWLSGRVHFRRRPCNIMIQDGGDLFTAFRRIEAATPKGGTKCAGAVIRVQFSFKNLSPSANRMLSLIPVPLILAQPGFRSKTWLLGKRTGDFIGNYEFDTVEAAEAYRDSLPIKMMERRAKPGTLRFQIGPGSGRTK